MNMRVAIGEKGISPLHSLINARQEMFDNVYWHHTNRACMVMLLRATRSPHRRRCQADELIGHDDDSLLTRLASDAMPAATRRLARALRDRHIHKRAVEIGSCIRALRQAGELFFDPLARRAVETRLSEALAEEIGEPVPAEAS